MGQPPKSPRAGKFIAKLRNARHFNVLVALVVGASVAIVGYNLSRTNAATSWPTTPPAQICGNASMLNGPATAPAGAVTVNVGTNLENLTNNNPAGTTFWLKPGTHTFNYSVVPKDGNTYIGAPGAIIDGGGNEAIAFWEEFYGAKAKNVTISYLTIQNFTSGSENQGSIYGGVGWHIDHSTFKNHGYIAMFAGPDSVIEYSCFDSNGQMGIGTYRFDDNNYNVTADHNEFKNNNTRNLQDCGCAGGMKFWTTRKSKFTNNWVHNNKGVGVWADNNNIEILFEGNYIADNDDIAIFYEISYNFMIRNNYIARNTIAAGRDANDAFLNGGIYISESGGVSEPGFLYGTSEIHDNYFEDNWDGIAIWESGNRYKGSDEYSPEPAYGSSTHWKSQNIQIYNNEFHMSKAAVGCSGNPDCGRNGIFSDWVPVPGPAVSPNTSNNQYQLSVSFSQNNVFYNNKYYGDWTFASYDQGSTYNWTTWRNSKPNPISSFNYLSPGAFGFAQDAGSTFNDSGGANSAPTVSVTAPSDGSTVNGTITVAATASDDTSVVGVQFKVDGTNLGSEDTSSPYSTSLDTTTLSNGAHTISATARDGAGLTTTSNVTVTVNNPVVSKQGDVNSDNKVNVQDLSILLSNWNKTSSTWSNAKCDVNGDGKVTVSDLSILLSKWGT